MKTTKQKKAPPFTFWQNFRWYFTYTHKVDAFLIPQIFLNAILKTANALLVVLLPTTLVRNLTQHAPLTTLVTQVLLIGLGIAVTQALFTGVSKNGQIRSIQVRQEQLREFFGYGLTVSYDQLLLTKVREEFNIAKERNFSGNRSGAEYFYTATNDLFQGLITLILFGATLSFFSPLIFAVTLVAAALNYLGIYLTIHQREKIEEELEPYENQKKYLNDTASDLKKGKDLRLYRAGTWYQKLLQANFTANYTLLKKYNHSYFQRNLFKAGGVLLQNLVAYGYLLWGIAQKTIQLTQFTLYLSVLQQLNALVGDIAQNIFLLQRANSDLNVQRAWVKNYFATSTGSQPPALQTADALTLTFKNVTYQYPESSTPTLNNLSLTIHAGEKVALVGLNGAGKTTLIKVLTGLLTPTSGAVFVNGYDVASLDQDFYRQKIATVLQESILLADDVGHNISLAPTYDEEKIWQLLEQVHLKEKVASLPQQLATPLTRRLYPDGVEFSGGETQKLMLARALYKAAPLLILDEPTAALDALAEEALYRDYNTLAKDKTSIFISHRLASTRFCDRIFFLAQGQLQEVGTHEELLGKNGAYADMYRVQSHYYQEDLA